MEEQRPPHTRLGRRAWVFWTEHRTLLWTLHSVWALVTGIGVLLVARERYDFVLWVVAFLVLTWASTLFLGRNTGLPSDEAEPPGRMQKVLHGVTSYATRILYQETLFFLLPFYMYSTVVGSPNVVFVVLLGTLAVLSCLDLVFDRWLRRSAVFGLAFFAIVAFAAVNLLLPMVLNVSPRWGTPVAALLAVAGAVPLAQRGVRQSLWMRVRLGAATALFLYLALEVPGLVPPVPLRMTSATFSNDIQRGTLQLGDTLGPRVAAERLSGRLVLLVQVFAPSSVPTGVNLEWRRDGQVVRVSRDIQIVAHEAGFRVWDAWRPSSGVVPAGHYEVVLRTRNGRLFGVAKLDVGTYPDASPGT